MSQMNPLIGPILKQSSLFAVKRYWVSSQFENIPVLNLTQRIVQYFREDGNMMVTLLPMNLLQTVATITRRVIPQDLQFRSFVIVMKSILL